MGTYTPNLNLYKPDASDDFGSFRAEFNDNMDKLDNGGGGGSGGHTIIDENGASMTQRTGLQFTGNVSVSDDAVNDKTIVNISGGGGGSFFGCAIDENNKLFEGTINDFNQSLSYTATEDGIALCWYRGSVGTWQFLLVNGVMLRLGGDGTNTPVSYSIPIRKGDVVSARYQSGSESCYFWLSVYGIKQGTSGIFAPVIYSDAERKIGIWRDNKPLYQKTVTFDGARSHGSNVFSTGILDAEEIVSISGMASYASGGVNNKWIPFTFSDDSTQNGITNAVLKINSFLRSTGEIYAYIGADYQSTYAINRVRITIQYTKTTDTAGSGNWNTDGVPTVHYSTSEQVVGTFIDGRPVYQKSFYDTTALSSFVSIPHGILDLDVLVKTECTIRASDNSYQAPMTTDQNNAEIEITPTDIELYLNNDFVNVFDGGYFITLQYTKTTD